MLRGPRPWYPPFPRSVHARSKGDKVSLFSENSGRWLVADQAVMKCGAADAVRGGRGLRGSAAAGRDGHRARCCAASAPSDPVRRPLLAPLRLPAQVRGVSSTLEELEYILQHSESTGLIVQDAATLDRLLPTLRGSGGSGSSGGGASLPIRFVVQLWGEPSAEAATALGPALHTYADVLARGEQQVMAAQVPSVAPL